MPAIIKIITAIYIFIIAGIIVIANVRSTRYLLTFSGGIPYFDKIAHFLLMGGFSFFVNLVLHAKTFSTSKIRYLLGTLIVLIIVTIEEFSQIFVSGRAFDIGDLVADYLGIFLFGEIARLVVKRFAMKTDE